jgi:hypothetical protein
MRDTKFICPQVKAEIAETIRTQPTTSYRVIAEQYGVGMATVSAIAARNGLRRKKDPPAAYEPNRREGGIIADDAQWRARQERIG